MPLARYGLLLGAHTYMFGVNHVHLDTFLLLLCCWACTSQPPQDGRRRRFLEFHIAVLETPLGAETNLSSSVPLLQSPAVKAVFHPYCRAVPVSLRPTPYGRTQPLIILGPCWVLCTGQVLCTGTQDPGPVILGKESKEKRGS